MARGAAEQAPRAPVHALAQAYFTWTWLRILQTLQLMQTLQTPPPAPEVHLFPSVPQLQAAPLCCWEKPSHLSLSHHPTYRHIPSLGRPQQGSWPQVPSVKTRPLSLRHQQAGSKRSRHTDAEDRVLALAEGVRSSPSGREGDDSDGLTSTARLSSARSALLLRSGGRPLPPRCLRSGSLPGRCQISAAARWR